MKLSKLTDQEIINLFVECFEKVLNAKTLDIKNYDKGSIKDEKRIN